MRIVAITLVAGCLLTLVVGSARAKVGFRQLTTVFPVAVQRGTAATVQVRSNFTLDRAYQVFFAPAGPQMTLAEEKPIDAPLTARGTPGTPFRFQLQAPAAQEPGMYEFRIATPQAVSSVSHILVTDYPVVVEATKENGRLKSAQAFSVPATICGIVEEAEDVDCYRFTGKRGQRVTFQAYGQRCSAAVHDMVGKNQTYHFDPILTLYSPTGQIIGQNDNYFGGDSLLTTVLPTDGEHTIEIRDTRYLGNLRYTYAIEVSDEPLYQATFPLMIERGQSTQAELLAPGLDTLPQVTLTSSKQDAVGWQSRRFAVNGHETNPAQTGVSDLPQQQVAAQSAKDAPIEIALPSGVNGRLAEPGETHRFRFVAQKDRYYRFSIRAQQLGLPLDGVCEIFDEAGKKVAEADDQTFTCDPELIVKAPADGAYTLHLRDLHNRGGQEFVYHLAAEPIGPDFTLSGRFYYAMLAPGTHMMWFAKIDRLQGFDGPVTVHVDGLPEGVTYTPLTLPAGMTNGAMILSCREGAKIDASLARIWGEAEITGTDGKPQKLSRPAQVTAELQNGGGGQGFWPIQTSIVGVVEPMDLLKVEATPSEIKLERGGKQEITVKIERQADFTDPVTLECTHQYFTSKLGEQLPKGVTMVGSNQVRLSGKTLEAKITLAAANDAQGVERLPIGIVAGVSISFSINTLYSSNPLFLTISGDAPAAEPAKPAVKTKKK